jgi:hypothetical protein
MTMSRLSRIRAGGVLLALFGLLLCIGAQAANPGTDDDPDLQRVAHFRLDDRVVTQYIRAQKMLMQAVKAHPELQDQEDPSDAKTLDETIARLDKQPALRAALASAGMSTTDYVLCSFALMQSGIYAWGVQMDGKTWAKIPPGIPTENTKWVIAHKAELDKLKAVSGDGGSD